MDHLPHPPQNRRRSLSWRCPTTKLLKNVHDAYARTSFEGYTDQRGIHIEDIISGNFRPEQQHDAAAIVQNWLFFGLLETFFDVNIGAKSFLVNGINGQQYLCTQSIPNFYQQWLEKVQRMSETSHQQARDHLNKIFRTCLRFFQMFKAIGYQNYPPDFASYLNTPAILLETLQLWRHLAHGVHGPDEPLFANLSSFTVEELVAEGWCPYTISNILLTSRSPSCFAYARQYRGKPGFVHGDHSGCLANRCSIINVDTSSYKCQHRRTVCKHSSICVTRYPDLQLIGQKLQDKRTPVVRLSDDGQLNVMTEPVQEYVAISHVWSDGMGSTSEDGLWACQIEFLSEAATAAYN